MSGILILHSGEHFMKGLVRTLRRSEDPLFKITETLTAEAARAAVESAGEPFDVFLIDHCPNQSPDVIQLFKELRQLSPTTEGIILIGHDELDTGLQARNVGAYRYMEKPFDPRELIWTLQAVCTPRATRDERDWLQVLTEVARDMQQALTMEDVAKSIVWGGLRLGFERARLWVLSADGQVLEGKAAAGYGRTKFAGFQMKVADSPYAPLTLAQREPMAFQAQQYGLSPHHKYFAELGLRPPVGEWVEIPLWARNRCLGLLALDNAAQERNLQEQHRHLLSVWGGHVAAALDRVLLTEQAEAVSQIARSLTSEVSHGNLEKVLHSVHTSIGQLVDARNFDVILLNPQTQQLNVLLHVENGRLKLPPRRRHRDSIINQVITTNLPVKVAGKSGAQPLLAVPLRVNGRAVGAIVVQIKSNKGIIPRRMNASL